jgi:hypothetical protein
MAKRTTKATTRAAPTRGLEPAVEADPATIEPARVASAPATELPEGKKGAEAKKSAENLFARADAQARAAISGL